jgi:aryl-alcohol dehydrogenase-like predicted oxidoreductase
MELGTVQLGSSGLRVSEIALGTWRFGDSRTGEPDITEQQAYTLLDTYAAHGGNFIDTADRYGNGASERWIGNWLTDRDRDEFVVASKIGRLSRDRTDLSRKYLYQQLEQSLDRLGTDYLDILYAHRWDDDTPVEEFMGTLRDFVADGRVRYLGISTKYPNGWKVALANERAKRNGYEPFVVSQPQYNLVRRHIEENYLDMCRHYGMGVVPFNALGEGFLTGKYDRDEDLSGTGRAASESTVVERYFSDENFDVVELLEEIGDECGATPAQVSLAWLLRHPAVTAPVVGARTVEQLEENLRASTVELTDDQFERLSEAGQ